MQNRTAFENISSCVIDSMIFWKYVFSLNVLKYNVEWFKYLCKIFEERWK